MNVEWGRRCQSRQPRACVFPTLCTVEGLELILPSQAIRAEAIEAGHRHAARTRPRPGAGMSPVSFVKHFKWVERGKRRIHEWPNREEVIVTVTVHQSSILRAPDVASRAQARRQFVQDFPNDCGEDRRSGSVRGGGCSRRYRMYAGMCLRRWLNHRAGELTTKRRRRFVERLVQPIARQPHTCPSTKTGDENVNTARSSCERNQGPVSRGEAARARAAEALQGRVSAGLKDALNTHLEERSVR